MLDDWDDNFAMEEDYLPVNLHDDVLTPQEKMRRLSRTEHELSSSQRDFSGFDRIAGTSATKVGSPLGSSPSRFGALFARQRQRKEEEQQALTSSSFNHLHIGSPLRESSLHAFSNTNNNTSSPSLRPIGSRPTSGDISPFVSSPNTRQSSMSMISQQLHNMSLHPSTTTTTSTNSNPSRQQPPSSINNLSTNRTASSPMTFATSRIDEEEQSDLVFSMEEEEKENNKRNSATWGATASSPFDSSKKPTSSSSSVSSGTTETNGF
jgi:hypothetical protein